MHMEKVTTLVMDYEIRYPLSIPITKEDCENQLIRYMKGIKERSKHYSRGCLDGYKQARKMYYEALIPIFFTVSKFESVHRIHSWSRKHKAPCCAHSSDRVLKHIWDVKRVLTSLTRICVCCFYLDRLEECKEMCELVVDLCQKYHRKYFVTSTLKHGDVCQRVIPVYCLLSQLGIIEENFEGSSFFAGEGSRMNSHSELLEKTRRYLQVKMENDEEVSDFRYLEKRGIREEFDRISLSSEYSEYQNIFLHLDDFSFTPKYYSDLCDLLETKERDEYSPKPFKEFLNKVQGSDDLDNERVEFVQSSCDFMIRFMNTVELKTINVPKILFCCS